MAFAEIKEFHNILPTDIPVVAFGIGIDYPDIHQIFYYGLPSSMCKRQEEQVEMAYSHMLWMTWEICQKGD